MLKKSGIIVGVTIIAIGCLIFWLVGRDKTGESKTSPVSVTTPLKDDKTVQQHENSQQNIEQPKDVTSVNSSEQVNSTEPVTSSKQTSTTSEQETPTSSISEVAESDLGKPIKVRTEVMVVSNKRIVLMDGNVGKPTDKQLIYCIDLLYGDGTMNLYVNGVVYSKIKVTDKLKVTYKVYKNNSGVKFPVIMSADTM